MLVRYLPVIFVLVALVLALAPLETAGQPATSSPAAAGSKAQDRPEGKDDEQARPKTPGAPVNAGADKKAVPPDTDARKVRPAEAFPPERIAPSRGAAPSGQAPQAPSRGGVQTPDQPATGPAGKDDPRSVEERPDPGG